MKRRNIFISIIAVFLLVLIPTTPALEVQAVEQRLSTSPVSYKLLTAMTSDDLVVFIKSLAKDYPELSTVFERAVENIGNSMVPSNAFPNVPDVRDDKNQGTSPRADNQTILEKIFWKIFNYRVLRLLISTFLFIKIQSKITLWRTITWGIRLLRWTKIGILLGFIDPSQQAQTPTIQFEQNDVNNTLTVLAVVPAGILWDDIEEIGAGSCDPIPTGEITAGDMLTNCTGFLVLRHIPTNQIVGVFEFD